MKDHIVEIKDVSKIFVTKIRLDMAVIRCRTGTRRGRIPIG